LNFESLRLQPIGVVAENWLDFLASFLMKRKPRPALKNSTQFAKSREQFDAECSNRELRARVVKLESIIADYLGPGILDSTDFASVGRKKRGPRSIHDVSLISERNRLIQMLEAYWPEIEPLTRPKPKADALEKLLQQIACLENQLSNSQGRHAHAAEHFLKHFQELVKFLLSDRFRHDPRQIANAFAGFPNMGTWRSLKRCQAHPSNEPIGQRAIRAYILRKNPRLYARAFSGSELAKFCEFAKSLSR
jgi:hypothetical protein